MHKVFLSLVVLVLELKILLKSFDVMKSADAISKEIDSVRHSEIVFIKIVLKLVKFF